MEEFDVIVVGSGFGGGVAALRLTEKGYRVLVLEAGRRFSAADFPRTSWNPRRFLFFPRLGLRGIQRLTLLHDVLVLSGAGVGGGSLVYANVLCEPLEPFWHDPQWAGIADWKTELAPYFERARRMLGAAPVPFETLADVVMKQLAGRLEVAESYHQPEVGVYFGPPGEEAADPYFGGAGPRRSGCLRCGGCLVGCRHNAKNTLDRNYLYLAERRGAIIQPERRVVDLVPLPEGGYEVVSERTGAWLRKRGEAARAGQVVLAAGVLGTLGLLLALRRKGRLPRLSPRLGENVRTNSEAIVGASARSRRVDYSTGVAITSSIHPDELTQIQPVRYPKGSNALGLLGTLLVDGGGRLPRQLRFLGQVARHPLLFLRSLSAFRWSERTIILLVMQARSNSLRVTARRGLLGYRLSSTRGEGEPSPAYLPVANEAARIAAELIGGAPGSALNEVLLNVPTTAHILGGACIGDSPERGVIDPYQRVFGCPGLHVVDGSALSANLGANPALTIAAQAERAVAHWPNRGEPDPRPPLGEAYRPLEPVPPRWPAVPAHAPAALGRAGVGAASS